MHNQFQIKNFLETTLKNLEAHKLHPVPDNYRLWYEYAAASDNELNSEVDELIAKQIAISEEICQQLFKKYLTSNDQKDIDCARLAFSHLLNIMIGQISKWSDSSDEFCRALKQCTDKLNDNPSIHDIKAIVAEITSETETLSATNNSINTTLSSLNKEVNKLRKDLAQAGAEAITDSLTGISNRRGMDGRLASAVEEANRHRTDLSVIMVDIDKFKDINDNFGHQVGDKILKFIASIMQRNLRATDYIARYGGEEFLIILPHTNEQGAIQVAEHIRKAVSEKPLSTGNTKNQVIGRITISLGVAQYRLLESIDDLVDRADRCMYAAKHTGRDNVKGEDALSIPGM